MPLVTSRYVFGDNGGGHWGPFRRSNGDLIVFTVDAGLTNVYPSVSTDGGANWSDGTSTSIGLMVYSLWAEYDAANDLLHVAMHVSGGSVLYNTYNPATDAWGTLETVNSHTNGNSPGFGVALAIDPDDGHAWILYQDDYENVGGTYYRRLGLAERTAADTYRKWPVDPGGTQHWTVGDIKFFGDGLVHLLYGSWQARPYYRTFDPDTEAFSTPVDLHGGNVSFSVNCARRMVAYDDGGVQRITTAYYGPSAYPYAQTLDDGSTGTAGPITSTAVAVWDSDNSAALALVCDAAGKKVYAVFADSATGDLWLDVNTDSGGWGTDTELADNVTVRWVDATIYTNSNGEIVIGILYDQYGVGVTFLEYVLREASVEVNLAAAGLSVSAQAATVEAGLVVELGPAAVQATALATAPEGGPVEVELAPAALAGTAGRAFVGEAEPVFISAHSPYGDNGGGHWGPHRTGSGDLIAFGRSSGSTATVIPHRSADGGATWSAGTGQAFATTVYAFWSELDAGGQVIHCAVHLGNGAVSYLTYTPSTDTWGAVETVHTNIHGAADGFGVVVRQHPATGNLWFCYQGDMEDVYGIDRLRVYLTERTAPGAYTTPLLVDGAGQNQYYTLGDMLIEPGGLIHLLYGTWQTRVFHRSYNGVSLSEVQEVSDTVAPFANNGAKRMAHYQSGTIDRITLSWRGPGGRPYASFADNDGMPTAEEAVSASAAAVWDADNSAAIALVADAGAETAYLIYAASDDGSLYLSENHAAAGWSAPGAIVSGVAARWVNASVYTNSSSQVVIGILYEEDGVGLSFYEYPLRSLAGVPVSVSLGTAVLTCSAGAGAVSNRVPGEAVIVNVLPAVCQAVPPSISLSGSAVSVLLAAAGVAANGYQTLPALELQAYRWALRVDWDNDGVFEADESARLVNLKVRRGRQEELGSEGSGRAPYSPGSCFAVLDNSDGRYDAWNAASPLYPNVLPARRCYIDVSFGSWTSRVFTGVIKDLVPQGRRGTVQLSIVEPPQVYASNVRLGVLQNVTALDVFWTLVAYSGAQGAQSGNSLDVLRFWWPTSDTYLGCMQDLAEAFGDDVVIDVYGRAKYIAHGWAYTPVGMLSEGQLRRDFEINQPWQSVRNRVSVESVARDIGPLAVLWTLPDVPAIAQGGTFETTAIFSGDQGLVPAISVWTPVAGVDFIANTAADGSGTDVTSRFTVSMNVYGTHAAITARYTGAGNPAYITRLQVRGRALSPTNRQTVVRRDTASIAAYGERSLNITNPLIQSYGYAMPTADHLLQRYSTSRLNMVVRLESLGEQVQFNADLASRIRLTIDSEGVDQYMKVAGIAHEWGRDTGQTIVTTLWLEPWDDYTTYWHFPTTLGVTSRLGG